MIFFALYFWLIIPYLLGLLLFIVGIIMCLVGKIKHKRSVPGIVLASVGFAIVFVMTTSFILTAIIGEKKEQAAYDAAPNKIMMESFSADSFAVDGVVCKRVDFLNKYQYDLFMDTRYTVVVNRDNYKTLRVCKNQPYKIYFAYGDCLFCPESEVNQVWEEIKNTYDLSIVSFMDYQQCDIPIKVGDMDKYLEIWRYIEGIDKKEYHELDEGLSKRKLRAASADGMSVLDVSVGWDEEGNWYFMQTSTTGTEMNDEYADYFKGLDFTEIEKQ